jgi:hypothetical protein
MNKDILPIGSVVRYDKDLFMIIGYLDKNKSVDINGKNKTNEFDYISCKYPIGVEGQGPILLVRDAIKEVVFIGYQDGSFVKTKEKLKEYGWK